MMVCGIPLGVDMDMKQAYSVRCQRWEWTWKNLYRDKTTLVGDVDVCIPRLKLLNIPTLLATEEQLPSSLLFLQYVTSAPLDCWKN